MLGFLLFMSLFVAAPLWAEDSACPRSLRQLFTRIQSDDLDRHSDALQTLELFQAREKVFTSTSNKTLAAAHHNSQVLRALKSSQIIPQDKIPQASWRPAATLSQASELRDWVRRHPVTGNANHSTYDPNYSVGFCFGRAAAIHLQALRQPYRIHPSAIRKIWILGPMKGNWGHHVASMVYVGDAPAPGFHVIDSIMNDVMTAEAWTQKIIQDYQIDPKNPLTIFVTDAERFGPAPGNYSRINFFGPRRGDREADAYKGYFEDLMKEFRASGAEQRQAIQKEIEILQRSGTP